MPFEDVCEKRLKARKRESIPKIYKDAANTPAASKVICKVMFIDRLCDLIAF